MSSSQSPKSVTHAPLGRLPEEWAEALKGIGAKPFHARQIFRWLHARSVFSPAGMSDLPKPLRSKLETLELESTIAVTDARHATDGTRKLLVAFRDGATVETVLIPGVSGGRGALPSPLPAASDAADDADAAAAVDDEDEAEVADGASSAATSDEPVRVTQCVSTQVGCAMGCVFCNIFCTFRAVW